MARFRGDDGVWAIWDYNDTAEVRSIHRTAEDAAIKMASGEQVLFWPIGTTFNVARELWDEQSGRPVTKPREDNTVKNGPETWVEVANNKEFGDLCCKRPECSSVFGVPYVEEHSYSEVDSLEKCYKLVASHIMTHRED